MPKVVLVQVRKPETVKEVKRVKKTKMVLQNVIVKKSKSPRPTPRGAKKPVKENEPVEKRQGRINAGYQEIVGLARKRYAYLEDAIRLFGFYRECDDFEKWIREKEKMLNTDDKDEGVENAKRKFEYSIMYCGALKVFRSQLHRVNWVERLKILDKAAAQIAVEVAEALVEASK